MGFMNIAEIPNNEIELLWKNNDFTQPFPPQTVTLNTNKEYTLYLVVFGLYANLNSYKMTVSQLVFKDHQAQAVGVINYTQPSHRLFSQTGIGEMTFYDGYRYSSSPDNSVMIPIAIYGIKKDFLLWE